MSDLSGYKDLSRSPISLEDELSHDAPLLDVTTPDPMRGNDIPPLPGFASRPQSPISHTFSSDKIPSISPDLADFRPDADTEFSGNVQTLIKLVSDLPEGVTKQTGAQIIRLTMEAMGISMEEVLSEAQSAQSEMLEAVRANIKKIEEFKTVIRKLETDIKYYQGKANELSEIIDLFILSNTSPGKMPSVDELTR